MSTGNLSGIHIIGAGGLGRDFVACFKAEIIINGFWDDKVQAGDFIDNFPVFGSLKELVQLPQPVSVIIAAGNPSIRTQIAGIIMNSHHTLATVIHSTVRIFDVQHTQLGPGCVVFPGTQITTAVTIGTNTIVHSCCSLHHDTRIGSNCMIMPGTICAGNVEIGDEVYIGPQRALTYGAKIKSGERCE